MKVCFLLQRRFAYVGHAIIYHLNRSFGISEFCAYVSVRSSYEYLQNQNDIKYTSLLLDEDVHDRALKIEKVDYEYLKNIEHKYGLPNLWPFLYVDRVIMNGQLIREYPHNEPLVNHQDMLRLVEGTGKAIEEFLDREKPDAVVFSVVASLGASLLYYMAKKRGIKTICIDLTRIKNAVAFSEDYKTFSWANDIFTQLEKGGKPSPFLNEARSFISEFRVRPTPYYDELRPDFNNQTSRKAHLSFLKPDKLKWSIFWHMRQLYRDLTQKKRDYSDIYVWWTAWDKLKRKIRGLSGYNRYWHSVKENEPFAFFPLHYEPETALMLYAPLYTNQIEAIKQSARALPVGMYLYVKEHPRMVGLRNRAFYKEVAKIPNVRLINPAYYGPDIVKKSKLIITISSTSGWEGAIFGLPVITFGDIFYNSLPSVTRCRSFEELAAIVEAKLKNSGHNEKSLQNFIAALMEESVNVDYVDLWNKVGDPERIKEDGGIVKMAELLSKKVKKS